MKKLVSIIFILLVTGCGKGYIAPLVEDSPNAKAAKALLATSQTPVHIAGKVYFFGDSITQGFDGNVINQNNWVALVSAFFGLDGRNLGIGGTTMEKSINGTDAPQSMYYRSLNEIPVKGTGDKYLFFAYGINDVGKNAPDMTPEQFTSDYQFVLNNAFKQGWQPKDIVLLNIYYCVEPALSDHDKIYPSDTTWLTRFNIAIKAIADKNATRFIDVHEFMKTYGAQYLLSGDNIHPNETGYAVIARGIEAAVSGFQ